MTETSTGPARAVRARIATVRSMQAIERILPPITALAIGTIAALIVAGHLHASLGTEVMWLFTPVGACYLIGDMLTDAARWISPMSAAPPAPAADSPIEAGVQLSEWLRRLRGDDIDLEDEICSLIASRTVPELHAVIDQLADLAAARPDFDGEAQVLRAAAERIDPRSLAQL